MDWGQELPLFFLLAHGPEAARHWQASLTLLTSSLQIESHLGARGWCLGLPVAGNVSSCFWHLCLGRACLLRPGLELTGGSGLKQEHRWSGQQLCDHEPSITLSNAMDHCILLMNKNTETLTNAIPYLGRALPPGIKQRSELGHISPRRKTLNNGLTSRQKINKRRLEQHDKPPKQTSIETQPNKSKIHTNVYSSQVHMDCSPGQTDARPQNEPQQMLND